MAITVCEVGQPWHDNSTDLLTLPVSHIKSVLVKILGRWVDIRPCRHEINPKVWVVTVVRSIVRHGLSIEKDLANDGCMSIIRSTGLPLGLIHLYPYLVYEVLHSRHKQPMEEVQTDFEDLILRRPVEDSNHKQFFLDGDLVIVVAEIVGQPVLFVLSIRDHDLNVIVIHQLVGKISEVKVDLCSLQRFNHLPVEPILDTLSDYIVVPVCFVQIEVGDVCSLQSSVGFPCGKSLGK